MWKKGILYKELAGGGVGKLSQGMKLILERVCVHIWVSKNIDDLTSRVLECCHLDMTCSITNIVQL